ncbi:conserved Plasmodium protein, unknown function [Plasmodium ovale wallikeri]|uniref:Uncharacterized protein n=1 Tax=Plasmodium ovale wallikeri TaxID=864142 RepID=A0A1A8ZTY1_PLAOA|nr:conserved Plasmodium protein, unknown function [Plasmodium ovale wallikeri]SBT47995.1 conserved Plasmodium protein, unknown function [Plasmodium ovale wallikeri]
MSGEEHGILLEETNVLSKKEGNTNFPSRRKKRSKSHYKAKSYEKKKKTFKQFNKGRRLKWRKLPGKKKQGKKYKKKKENKNIGAQNEEQLENSHDTVTPDPSRCTSELCNLQVNISSPNFITNSGTLTSQIFAVEGSYKFTPCGCHRQGTVENSSKKENADSENGKNRKSAKIEEDCKIGESGVIPRRGINCGKLWESKLFQKEALLKIDDRRRSDFTVSSIGSNARHKTLQNSLQKWVEEKGTHEEEGAEKKEQCKFDFTFLGEQKNGRVNVFKQAYEKSNNVKLPMSMLMPIWECKIGEKRKTALKSNSLSVTGIVAEPGKDNCGGGEKGVCPDDKVQSETENRRKSLLHEFATTWCAMKGISFPLTMNGTEAGPSEPCKSGKGSSGSSGSSGNSGNSGSSGNRGNSDSRGMSSMEQENGELSPTLFNELITSMQNEREKIVDLMESLSEEKLVQLILPFSENYQCVKYFNFLSIEKIQKIISLLEVENYKDFISIFSQNRIVQIIDNISVNMAVTILLYLSQNKLSSLFKELNIKTVIKIVNSIPLCKFYYIIEFLPIEKISVLSNHVTYEKVYMLHASLSSKNICILTNSLNVTTINKLIYELPIYKAIKVLKCLPSKKIANSIDINNISFSVATEMGKYFTAQEILQVAIHLSQKNMNILLNRYDKNKIILYLNYLSKNNFESIISKLPIHFLTEIVNDISTKLLIHIFISLSENKIIPCLCSLSGRKLNILAQSTPTQNRITNLITSCSSSKRSKRSNARSNTRSNSMMEKSEWEEKQKEIINNLYEKNIVLILEQLTGQKYDIFCKLLNVNKIEKIINNESISYNQAVNIILHLPVNKIMQILHNVKDEKLQYIKKHLPKCINEQIKPTICNDNQVSKIHHIFITCRLLRFKHIFSICNNNFKKWEKKKKYSNYVLKRRKDNIIQSINIKNYEKFLKYISCAKIVEMDNIINNITDTNIYNENNIVDSIFIFFNMTHNRKIINKCIHEGGQKKYILKNKKTTKNFLYTSHMDNTDQYHNHMKTEKIPCHNNTPSGSIYNTGERIITSMPEIPKSTVCKIKNKFYVFLIHLVSLIKRHIEKYVLLNHQHILLEKCKSHVRTDTTRETDKNSPLEHHDLGKNLNEFRNCDGEDSICLTSVASKPSQGMLYTDEHIYSRVIFSAVRKIMKNIFYTVRKINQMEDPSFVMKNISIYNIIRANIIYVKKGSCGVELQGPGGGSSGTERGRSELGRSERGRSERGRSELGRSERGRSERGISERDRIELGISERGRSERDRSEREGSPKPEGEIFQKDKHALENVINLRVSTSNEGEKKGKKTYHTDDDGTCFYSAGTAPMLCDVTEILPYTLDGAKSEKSEENIFFKNNHIESIENGKEVGTAKVEETCNDLAGGTSPCDKNTDAYKTGRGIIEHFKKTSNRGMATKFWTVENLRRLATEKKGFFSRGKNYSLVGHFNCPSDKAQERNLGSPPLNVQRCKQILLREKSTTSVYSYMPEKDKKGMCCLKFIFALNDTNLQNCGNNATLIVSFFFLKKKKLFNKYKHAILGSALDIYINNNGLEKCVHINQESADIACHINSAIVSLSYADATLGCDGNGEDSTLGGDNCPRQPVNKLALFSSRKYFPKETFRSRFPFNRDMGKFVKNSKGYNIDMRHKTFSTTTKQHNSKVTKTIRDNLNFNFILLWTSKEFGYICLDTWGALHIDIEDPSNGISLKLYRKGTPTASLRASRSYSGSRSKFEKIKRAFSRMKTKRKNAHVRDNTMLQKGAGEHELNRYDAITCSDIFKQMSWQNGDGLKTKDSTTEEDNEICFGDDCYHFSGSSLGNTGECIGTGIGTGIGNSIDDGAGGDGMKGQKNDPERRETQGASTSSGKPRRDHPEVENNNIHKREEILGNVPHGRERKHLCDQRVRNGSHDVVRDIFGIQSKHSIVTNKFSHVINEAKKKLSYKEKKINKKILEDLNLNRTCLNTLTTSEKEKIQEIKNSELNKIIEDELLKAATKQYKSRDGYPSRSISYTMEEFNIILYLEKRKKKREKREKEEEEGQKRKQILPFRKSAKYLVPSIFREGKIRRLKLLSLVENSLCSYSITDAGNINNEEGKRECLHFSTQNSLPRSSLWGKNFTQKKFGEDKEKIFLLFLNQNEFKKQLEKRWYVENYLQDDLDKNVLSWECDKTRFIHDVERRFCEKDNYITFPRKVCAEKEGEISSPMNHFANAEATEKCGKNKIHREGTNSDNTFNETTKRNTKLQRKISHTFTNNSGSKDLSKDGNHITDKCSWENPEVRIKKKIMNKSDILIDKMGRYSENTTKNVDTNVKENSAKGSPVGALYGYINNEMCERKDASLTMLFHESDKCVYDPANEWLRSSSTVSERAENYAKGGTQIRNTLSVKNHNKLPVQFSRKEEIFVINKFDGCKTTPLPFKNDVKGEIYMDCENIEQADSTQISIECQEEAEEGIHLSMEENYIKTEKTEETEEMELKRKQKKCLNHSERQETDSNHTFDINLKKGKEKVAFFNVHCLFENKSENFYLLSEGYCKASNFVNGNVLVHAKMYKEFFDKKQDSMYDMNMSEKSSIFDIFNGLKKEENCCVHKKKKTLCTICGDILKQELLNDLFFFRITILNKKQFFRMHLIINICYESPLIKVLFNEKDNIKYNLEKNATQYKLTIIAIKKKKIHKKFSMSKSKFFRKCLEVEITSFFKTAQHLHKPEKEEISSCPSDESQRCTKDQSISNHGENILTKESSSYEEMKCFSKSLSNISHLGAHIPRAFNSGVAIVNFSILDDKNKK